MDINELRKNIDGIEISVLVAAELGFFISDGCHDVSLTLYEAFLLTDLELELSQKGAMQPAWSHSLWISHLLGLERLFVLAKYFKNTRPSGVIIKNYLKHPKY